MDVSHAAIERHDDAEDEQGSSERAAGADHAALTF